MIGNAPVPVAHPTDVPLPAAVGNRHSVKVNVHWVIQRVVLGFLLVIGGCLDGPDLAGTVISAHGTPWGDGGNAAERHLMVTTWADSEVDLRSVFDAVREKHQDADSARVQILCPGATKARGGTLLPEGQFAGTGEVAAATDLDAGESRFETTGRTCDF